MRKQKIIQKKFSKHKQKFTKRLVNRANKKIATAPAKIVPLLGVATIITMTTIDVNAFCDDINEMNTLEKNMFGKVTNSEWADEVSRVCNYDIKKHLSPQLQKQYDKPTQYIKSTYNSSIEKLKGFF